jgi:hypothetical protein
MGLQNKKLGVYGSQDYISLYFDNCQRSRLLDLKQFKILKKALRIICLVFLCFPILAEKHSQFVKYIKNAFIINWPSLIAKTDGNILLQRKRLVGLTSESYSE